MPVELALHVPHAGRLPQAGSPLPAPGDGIPGGAYGRLYFGTEVCTHLLPSPAGLDRALALAGARGLAFTLLTPYATDRAVLRLRALLRRLSRSHPGAEVVVNDWGVLRVVRELGAPLVPVVGRLLVRTMRDPRIPALEPADLMGEPVPPSWRASSMGSASFRQLLSGLGIRRAEVDHPPHGLEVHPRSERGEMGLTVHAPYGVIASGRLCAVHAVGRPGASPWAPPSECSAPCRLATLELTPPWSAERPGGGDTAFFQKGNTRFYRLGEGGLAAARAWAEASGVDRWVYAPWVPM